MNSWRFLPKIRGYKEREPMQQSFFDNESIDNDIHALVRENGQNSKDASHTTSDVPVKIKISLGVHEAGSSVMQNYISDNAWSHFDAEDSGLQKSVSKDSECKYLVFEDFNTTGLIGDETSDVETPDNSFYYFMRAEGISGKGEDEIGRHGIGKFVSPKMSAIRTFFMTTVRSDDGRCLIAGQSVIKAHTVDGKRFTPDGWWGVHENAEDDSFQLPIEDDDLFYQIKKDFCLSRQLDETGLSIVIPYIESDICLKKIGEYFIREFFLPILSEQIIIELNDASSSWIINSELLRGDLIGTFFSGSWRSDFKPYIDLAVRAIDEDNITTIKLLKPERPYTPVLGRLVNKDFAEKIGRELTKENRAVCIQVPLYVARCDSSEFEDSFFKIYLLRDEDELSRRTIYIRQGISVLESKEVKIRGYFSLVVIEKGPLATLLGDSENPAHTEWEKNAHKFKNKYKWGAKTIDFVRLSASRLLKLLSQADEKEDRNVLADIFYINLPQNMDDVPESRRRKKKNKEGGGEPSNEIEEIRSNPRYFRLSRIEGGFEISGTDDEIKRMRQFTVVMAYDMDGVSKSRAFKGYDKNDFDLSKLNSTQIHGSGVDNLKANENCLKFTSEDKNFLVKVAGFDENRDLIVETKSKEVGDEEI